MDEREARLRLEHESRYGLPHTISAKSLSREAPVGWVGHHVAFRHVRSRLPVNIEQMNGHDGSRWFVATVGNLGTLPEHILLAGRAFFGAGARVRIVPPFEETIAAVHLMKRLDRTDEPARVVLLEEGAVAAFVANRADVASVPRVPWRPDDLFEAGNPVPRIMTSEWTPFIEIGEVRSYLNEEAGLVVTEGPRDGRRLVGLELAEGKWTHDKIMEGATSFIARGTPVELIVDVTPTRGTCIRILHTLDGQGAPGMISLEDEAVAKAIAPHAAKLRNARPLSWNARERAAKN
jgi:hypothetical protein